MDLSVLKTTIYNSLLELESEDGINASGKEEIYGCIFGRDSAITILKILKAVSNSSFPEGFEKERLLAMCKKTLLTLVRLQGSEVNIESGEEPGKFIHEYRKERFEHLVQSQTPWYIYADGQLKNYDSIDSTPLVLIALYRYWQVTGDEIFLLSVLDSVEKGLHWIMDYGDRDKDFLLEYEFSPIRTFGGLKVQSWTDSLESLLDSTGKMPLYPIAPVEAQGYAWLALKVWSEYFSSHKRQRLESKTFPKQLVQFAHGMKERFNDVFILKNGGLFFAAQALDGNKKQIKTITGNPLLLLWASYGVGERAVSIVHKEYVSDFVKRGFVSDLYDESAGVRTMSSESETFNAGQNSYHNGSFWPKLNGMIFEGLLRWGFHDEALRLKEASLRAIQFFGTPIELYVKGTDVPFLEYKNEFGQVSCRNQAWSAASVLDMLTE